MKDVPRDLIAEQLRSTLPSETLDQFHDQTRRMQPTPEITVNQWQPQVDSVAAPTWLSAVVAGAGALGRFDQSREAFEAYRQSVLGRRVDEWEAVGNDIRAAMSEHDEPDQPKYRRLGRRQRKGRNRE